MISVTLCVKKHPSQNQDPPFIGELIIKSNVEEKLLSSSTATDSHCCHLNLQAGHPQPSPCTRLWQCGKCPEAMKLGEVTVQTQLFPAASQLPSSPGAGCAFPSVPLHSSPHPPDRAAARPAQAAHGGTHRFGTHNDTGAWHRGLL